MSQFLNLLDSTDQLAKTILYNLNPSYNEVFATMAGNFNDGSIKGKVQFGSGWWYLDQLDGMEKQMTTLSNMGILSCFVVCWQTLEVYYPFHDTSILDGCSAIFLEKILNRDCCRQISPIWVVLYKISVTTTQKHILIFNQ